MSTVSESALADRIRRALRRDGESLHFPRSQRDRLEMGESYLVNDSNFVIAYRCSVEGLAQELGLLKPGERIA
jgi:hypothetical protein